MKISIRNYSVIGLMIIAFYYPVQSYAKPIVRMQTTMGEIEIELYDGVTALTTANFLRYVRDGEYNNTFIHRNVSNFIVQGGGYKWESDVTNEWGGLWYLPPFNLADPPTFYPAVLSKGAIPNQPYYSNIRGTIAMAKSPGDPNSATNQWFFNVADNSSNLDNQNGGFTAFGKVMNNGMDVVDVINSLVIFNMNLPLSDPDYPGWPGSFSDVPLIDYPGSIPGPVTQDNIVIVTDVFEDVNRDGISDQNQAHIHSLWTDSLGGAEPRRYTTFISTVGTSMFERQAASIEYLRFFLAGNEFFLAGNEPFPDGKIVNFVYGLQIVEIDNIIPAGSPITVTQILPEDAKVSSYYIFGPTPDDPSKHWYEFMYDGRTGAKINGNIITLHFVDGERGDFDMTANGLVAAGHTSGPAETESIDNGVVDYNASGCTLSAGPPDARGGGAWGLILLFLVIIRFYRHSCCEAVQRK